MLIPILVFDETNFASVSLSLQLTSLVCILKECGRISSSIKDCIQSTICRSAHWTPHHISTTHSAVLQPASVCVLPPFVGLLSTLSWNGNSDQTRPRRFSPPSWEVCKQKSPLTYSTRAVICLRAAGVACWAPTDQRRVLINPTDAGVNGTHLPQRFSPGHTDWRDL